MKKFILSLAFMAIASMASAQLMQSSAWITTKYPFQPRFEQMVNLSYDNILTYGHSSFTASYIVGYRFGYHLFLGGGIGFNFTMSPGYQYMDMVNDDYYGYDEYGSLCRTTQTFNLPIFAYARAYLSKSKHSPFFALAFGGRFSTPREIELKLGHAKFGTCGLLLNPQFGMSHYLSNSTAFYYAIGFLGQTFPEFTNVTHNSLEVVSGFNWGVNAHLGITF